MRSYRYVLHPEDLIKAQIEMEGNFEEIEILFDIDSNGKEYIFQVKDRLTIEDPYISLYNGFVKRKN